MKGSRAISKPHSLHQYTLRIQSVKMTIKFQCRMKIQLEAKPVTSEVSCSDTSNLYVFNEDIKISDKDSSQNFLTLSVSLTTSKGAKYIAGVAHLYHSQLVKTNEVGSTKKMVISLTKCLDPDAIMELYVKDVSRVGAKESSPGRFDSKTKRNRLVTIQNSRFESRKAEFQPQMSPKGQSFNFNQAGTRSEINLTRAPVFKTLEHKQSSRIAPQEKNSRSRKNLSIYYQRNLLQSRVSRHRNSYAPLTDRVYQHDTTNQQNRLEKQLEYKESYSKMKQKLRREEIQSLKQHQKRVSLEESQATAKIQALKYRLKCEELEQNVNDKSTNIKKLEGRISQLQKLLRSDPYLSAPAIMTRNHLHHSSAINLYQSQAKNTSEPTDDAIASLESKVQLANRQLEELRSKLVKMSKSYTEKEIALNKQLQNKKSRISKLEEELANAMAKGSSKNEEVLKAQLQIKSKIIQDMERENAQIMNKASQAERAVKSLEKKIAQLNKKIQELNSANLNISAEKIKLTQQVQSEKNRYSFSEFSATGLKKTIQKLQAQLAALQKTKQKYHDSLVQIKRIEGERKLEQKNHENITKQLQASFQVLQTKSHEQVQQLSRKNQQLESRNLQQSLKIRELQTHANTTLKNQIDNYKRVNQRLQRQCDELKNNQKGSRKEHLTYESKIGQINSELQVWKNKCKLLENSTKVANDRYTNEMTRLKAALQQEMMTQLALKEKIQGLTAELTVSTNKYSMLDEKYNKQTRDLSNRLEQSTSKNAQLVETIKKYERINLEIQNNEKNLRSKLQEYGDNETQYSDLIKKYQQQLSKTKRSLETNDQKLSAKTKQYDELVRINKETFERLSVSQAKNKQLTLQMRNLSNEFSNLQKQSQKMQYQLGSLRSSCQNKEKLLERNKASLQQQMKGRSELKEQMVKLQNSLENTHNDFERFKQHVLDVVSRQFTGTDGLDGVASFVAKIREVSSMKQSMTRAKNDLASSGNVRSSGIHFRTGTQETRTTHKQKTNTVAQPPARPTSAPGLSHSDVIGAVNQFTKQSKGLINKMIEEYRLLEKQHEYLKQNVIQKEAKFSQESQRYEESIHKLEESIDQLFIEKQALQKKTDERIRQLERLLTQTEEQLEAKRTELDESIYVCNGVKMEKQTEKQFFEHKIAQGLSKIGELQRNTEMLLAKIDNHEEQIRRLKIEAEAKTIQAKKNKETIDIKQKKVRDLEYQLNVLTKLFEDINSKNKQMQAQISQMQISLNNEREKNGKNLEIISQEEKKLTDTKDFVSSLIKQKQTMVKQDITNGQRIIELESMNINLKAQIEHLTGRLQAKSQQLTHQKQSNKKHAYSLKQTELQLQNLRQSCKKLSEQAKQKQRQIGLLLENKKSKQSQSSKEAQSKNKQLQQLTESKQLMARLHNQEVQTLKNEILRLENEVIKNLQQELRMTRFSMSTCQKELQSLQRSIQQKQYQINSYRELQTQLTHIREQNQQAITQLSNELREKQQQLFSLSGKLYGWQQRYSQLQAASRLELERVEQQFEYKYDGMVEDYETRLDEMEKERDYLKGKLLAVEDEARRNSEKLRTLEYEEGVQRSSAKDRLSKLEEEKNAVISNLRLELSKLNEQRQKLANTILKDNIQIEKLSNAYKTEKNLVQKLEIKLKEMEVKLEAVQAECHAAGQKQKKKQLYIKQYEEAVVNQQWMLEREIKKQLQSITKVVVSLGAESPETKRKIAEAVKEAQNRMSKLMSQKISINGSAWTAPTH